MTLRCLVVAEQRLRSGFLITLSLHHKDVQMGCETHSLTGKITIVLPSFLSFPLLSRLRLDSSCFLWFTQTSASDWLKRWNIQPHQQATLTTKPLLLEGRHLFRKLKGIICSFHKGTLRNMGPSYIIKELYHLYKKYFKGVIEEKQDIARLLLFFFLYTPSDHVFLWSFTQLFIFPILIYAPSSDFKPLSQSWYRYHF